MQSGDLRSRKVDMPVTKWGKVRTKTELLALQTTLNQLAEDLVEVRDGIEHGTLAETPAKNKIKRIKRSLDVAKSKVQNAINKGTFVRP